MDICIYHANCDDGFAAAWAVRRKYPNAEFYAAQYQQDPPDITNKDVIIVDFSYKRPVMEKIIEDAKSVTIFDHHISAIRDIQDLPFTRSCFDVERCGAVITWTELFPDETTPMFFDYIQDRDLWLKQMSDGDAFTMALRSYPKDFELWDKFVESSLKTMDLIQQGCNILRYHKNLVDFSVKRAHLVSVGNYTFVASNVPGFLASDVAGKLAEKYHDYDFAGTYYVNEDYEFIFSLRSRGDFDVSKVASEFGGGGHKNAAGFTRKGNSIDIPESNPTS